jgi:hypothetical protein
MANKRPASKIYRMSAADMCLINLSVTLRRWSVVGTQNGIQYDPFALPQNGLPIRLSLKKDTTPKS